MVQSTLLTGCIPRRIRRLWEAPRARAVWKNTKEKTRIAWKRAWRNNYRCKERTTHFPKCLHRRQVQQRRLPENYLLWIILWKLNASDQTISNYNGWCTLARKLSSLATLKKIVMTYLPPIESKVMELPTIYRYLTYLQKLSAEVNMPYVNVTLDLM